MKQFKHYEQNQLPMFPLDIGELIEENHLVRVINKFVDGLSIELLTKPFEKVGKPAYHPRMMMKVILYSYSTKLFSTRKIEKALLQDITYMWLSGRQAPDHNTINRFRGFYFREILEEVFAELLDFLHANGYIRFDTYFVDGTKIEADAGKYSHVWRKNTERYKNQLGEKVKQILKEIEEINAEEDHVYGDKSLEELGKDNNISSKKIKQAAESLDKRLKDKKNSKTKKSLFSRVKKLEKASEKLSDYEKQQKTLNKRNSYSKTDTDATFMRMKNNNELRPGYNLQVSSENQFVVNYTVSQAPADTSAFPEHLEKLQERGKKYIPKNYVGDAGYGSEENYYYLKNIKSKSYLKYNTFNSELKLNTKDIFSKDNMQYDKEQDCFICPAGKTIKYIRDGITITGRGYKSKTKIYECYDCHGCQFVEKCNKSKNIKVIKIRPQLEKYKQQTKSNLTSKKGVKLRKKRGPEIETFFGDLKMNQGYRRMRLRGLIKAQIELGYHCIVYNLRKLHGIELKMAQIKI